MLLINKNEDRKKSNITEKYKIMLYAVLFASHP